MKNKLFNNKTAKGLVSLVTIIILLSSILATSLFYNNNITAQVVKEVSVDNNEEKSIQITYVNDIKELNQLNEGWYEIRNGFVFYLETFDSYAPLYIRIRNPEQQNGLVVIDEDGVIIFYKDVSVSSEKEVVEVKSEETVENEVTGKVSGLEKVSGLQGKEIRVPITSTKPVKEPTRTYEFTIRPPQYKREIAKASTDYGIPPSLMFALVNAESGFRSNAVSQKGAKGLTQLMDGTAHKNGVKNPFNPIQNVNGGVKELSKALDRQGGNIILALNDYNAGNGRVLEAGENIPRIRETQEHFIKVILADYVYRNSIDPKTGLPTLDKPITLKVTQPARLTLEKLSEGNVDIKAEIKRGGVIGGVLEGVKKIPIIGPYAEEFGEFALTVVEGKKALPRQVGGNYAPRGQLILEKKEFRLYFDEKTGQTTLVDISTYDKPKPIFRATYSKEEFQNFRKEFERRLAGTEAKELKPGDTFFYNNKIHIFVGADKAGNYILTPIDEPRKEIKVPIFDLGLRRSNIKIVESFGEKFYETLSGTKAKLIAKGDEFEVVEANGLIFYITSDGYESKGISYPDGTFSFNINGQYYEVRDGKIKKSEPRIQRIAQAGLEEVVFIHDREAELVDKAENGDLVYRTVDGLLYLVRPNSPYAYEVIQIPLEDGRIGYYNLEDPNIYAVFELAEPFTITPEPREPAITAIPSPTEVQYGWFRLESGIWVYGTQEDLERRTNYFGDVDPLAELSLTPPSNLKDITIIVFDEKGQLEFKKGSEFELPRIAQPPASVAPQPQQPTTPTPPTAITPSESEFGWFEHKDYLAFGSKKDIEEEIRKGNVKEGTKLSLEIPPQEIATFRLMGFLTYRDYTKRDSKGNPIIRDLDLSEIYEVQPLEPTAPSPPAVVQPPTIVTDDIGNVISIGDKKATLVDITFTRPPKVEYNAYYLFGIYRVEDKYYIAMPEFNKLIEVKREITPQEIAMYTWNDGIDYRYIFGGYLEKYNLDKKVWEISAYDPRFHNIIKEEVAEREKIFLIEALEKQQKEDADKKLITEGDLKNYIGTLLIDKDGYIRIIYPGEEHFIIIGKAHETLLQKYPTGTIIFVDTILEKPVKPREELKIVQILPSLDLTRLEEEQLDALLDSDTLDSSSVGRVLDELKRRSEEKRAISPQITQIQFQDGDQLVAPNGKVLTKEEGVWKIQGKQVDINDAKLKSIITDGPNKFKLIKAKSGVTYENGKWYIEVEAGNKVEATPDKRGGFSYSVNGQSYYVDKDGQFFVQKEGGLIPIAVATTPRPSTTTEPQVPAGTPAVQAGSPAPPQAVPQFSSLNEILEKLPDGRYQLVRGTGEIRDAKGNLVGILDSDVSKKQEGDKLFVKTREFDRIAYVEAPIVDYINVIITQKYKDLTQQGATNKQLEKLTLSEGEQAELSNGFLAKADTQGTLIIINKEGEVVGLVAPSGDRFTSIGLNKNELEDILKNLKNIKVPEQQVVQTTLKQETTQEAATPEVQQGAPPPQLKSPSEQVKLFDDLIQKGRREGTVFKAKRGDGAEIELLGVETEKVCNPNEQCYELYKIKFKLKRGTEDLEYAMGFIPTDFDKFTETVRGIINQQEVAVDEGPAKTVSSDSSLINIINQQRLYADSQEPMTEEEFKQLTGKFIIDDQEYVWRIPDEGVPYVIGKADKSLFETLPTDIAIDIDNDGKIKLGDFVVPAPEPTASTETVTAGGTAPTSPVGQGQTSGQPATEPSVAGAPSPAPSGTTPSTAAGTTPPSAKQAPSAPSAGTEPKQTTKGEQPQAQTPPTTTTPAEAPKPYISGPSLEQLTEKITIERTGKDYQFVKIGDTWFDKRGILGISNKIEGNIGDYIIMNYGYSLTKDNLVITKKSTGQVSTVLFDRFKELYSSGNVAILEFKSKNPDPFTFDDAHFIWDGKQWLVTFASAIGATLHPAKDIKELAAANKEIIKKADELVKQGAPPKTITVFDDGTRMITRPDGKIEVYDSEGKLIVVKRKIEEPSTPAGAQQAPTGAKVEAGRPPKTKAPRVEPTPEDAYKIENEDYDSNSFTIQYQYEKDRSATAKKIIEQFLQQSFGQVLDLELAKEYSFKIGDKEAVLKREINGELNFYEKDSGKKVVMTKDTKIEISYVGVEVPSTTTAPAEPTRAREALTPDQLDPNKKLIEDQKRQADKEKPFTLSQLKQLFGNFRIDSDGYVWDLTDEEQPYVIGKVGPDITVARNINFEIDEDGDIIQLTTPAASPAAATPAPLPLSERRYLPPDSIQQGFKIAGREVTNVESIVNQQKQRITVITLKDGTKINVEEGQLVDTKTGAVTTRMGVKGEAIGKPGIPTREEKPIFEAPNKDGLSVAIYAPNKEGMQRIVIEGQPPIFVHKDVLGSVTEKNWDGTVTRTPDGISFKVTEQNKDRLITIKSDGTQQSHEKAYDSKGKPLSETIIEKIGLTGDTKITKVTGINTEKPQKEEELRFADGATRAIKFKGNTEEVDKVSYKSKDGKTLELSSQDFEFFKSGLAEDVDRFLRLAAEQGFKKPTIDDEGNLVEGNKKIQQIDTGSILVFDKDKVLKQLTHDGKEIQYSGDVKYDAESGEITLGKGASSETYIGGRLATRQTVSSDGLRKVDAEFSGKGVQVSIQSRDSITAEFRAAQTMDIGNRIDDPKSPVNQMYEVKTEAGTFYYDENVLGVKLYRLEERDGKQVRVEETSFSKETKEALGASINKFREKYENKPFSIAQEKSQLFFGDVEAVLTEFRGLGYFATLFFDEDSLLKWREEVDRIFATAYLGTEYWASAICATELDGEDEGIAFAETPQGLAQVGAHIEATRTEPITNEKGERIFIYKITFSVRNGDYAKDPRAPEEMKINVILKGEKTANVFKKEQTVTRGSSFARKGKNAIVQDSPTLFNEVCITFDNIPFRWKLSNNELCNKIQESAGAPTKITVPTPTTAPSKGAAPEEEINDF